MTFGDVVIFLIVAVMVVVASYVLYRDKRDGRSSCGGNCNCCSGNGCKTPVIQINDETKDD